MAHVSKLPAFGFASQSASARRLLEDARLRLPPPAVLFHGAPAARARADDHRRTFLA
jgi:hypothetical protein